MLLCRLQPGATSLSFSEENPFEQNHDSPLGNKRHSFPTVTEASIVPHPSSLTPTSLLPPPPDVSFSFSRNMVLLAQFSFYPPRHSRILTLVLSSFLLFLHSLSFHSSIQCHHSIFSFSFSFPPSFIKLVLLFSLLFFITFILLYFFIILSSKIHRLFSFIFSSCTSICFHHSNLFRFIHSLFDSIFQFIFPPSLFLF